MNDDNERSDASAGSLAWIPVTERLPEEYEHVIGWRRGFVRSFEVWRSTSGDWLFGDFERAGNITHWMPLPAPPTDAE